MAATLPEIDELPARLPLRKGRRWRSFILMTVIFASGCVISHFLTMYYVHHQHDRRRSWNVEDMIADSMSRNRELLKLDDAQMVTVEKLMRRHFETMNRIRRESQPLFDKEVESFEQDVAAVLNADQKKAWHERMTGMRRMWSHRPHRGKGDRSGPGSKSNPDSKNFSGSKSGANNAKDASDSAQTDQK